MIKYILLFIIITTLTYSKEENLIGNNIILLLDCNNQYNLCLFQKEEPKKFGQDAFDEYKKTEQNLKKQLNTILIPKFMSKSFKIDIDVNQIKNFKVACIYEPEQIVGLNFKVEWEKQVKFSSSFKKDFDISNLIEKTSVILSNTFIPE